ncbi:hypothetical protein F5B18DRAFT_611096 [Nemania serpens]|nr:hypothetical protein F5B18DRAFT_611096 [Nemania serpens]
MVLYNSPIPTSSRTVQRFYGRSVVLRWESVVCAIIVNIILLLQISCGPIPFCRSSLPLIVLLSCLSIRSGRLSIALSFLAPCLTMSKAM